MTEGERMTWLFNSVLPPPSPAALPFTLPPQYRSDTYLMRLDFGGQRDQEEPGSMLSAASRVTGLGVGGTLWSQSFVDSDKTHLRRGRRQRRHPLHVECQRPTLYDRKGFEQQGRVEHGLHVGH